MAVEEFQNLKFDEAMRYNCNLLFNGNNFTKLIFWIRHSLISYKILINNDTEFNFFYFKLKLNAFKIMQHKYVLYLIFQILLTLYMFYLAC